MKFLYLFFLFGLSFLESEAQQRPQYTQYIVNNYILNPAISGIENYIDVKVGYRNQWVGLNGSPVTNYVSIQAPIGHSPGDANSGEGSMNRSFLQNYKAAEPHHGIGMHAVIDKTGPLNRLDINATYAYHLGITEKINLAFGVAAGLSQINLDISKVVLDEAVDPAIVSTEASQLQPDLSAGLWIYGSRYFIGLSGQQLLGRNLSFSNETGSPYNTGKSEPHFFLTAGYKAFISEEIAVIPSVMIKKVSNINSFDTNVKFAFKDKFWVGGSYRNQDSFSALAGFNISYLFNLSYSYDFTTSDLQSVNTGTHEVVLGILLNNRNKVLCPQHNW